MRKQPPLVAKLVTHFDAWLVGSSAIAEEEPRDYDVCVPWCNWYQAVNVINPEDVVKPNSLGGYKCRNEGRIVDVWPDHLHNLLTNKQVKALYHPRTDTLIVPSSKRPPEASSSTVKSTIEQNYQYEPLVWGDENNAGLIWAYSRLWGGRSMWRVNYNAIGYWFTFYSSTELLRPEDKDAKFTSSEHAKEWCQQRENELMREAQNEKQDTNR